MKISLDLPFWFCFTDRQEIDPTTTTTRNHLHISVTISARTRVCESKTVLEIIVLAADIWDRVFVWGTGVLAACTMDDESDLVLDTRGEE